MSKKKKTGIAAAIQKMINPNPTDAPEMPKQTTIKEKEKNLLQTYAVMGIAMFIVVIWISLQYYCAKLDNPQGDFMSLFQQALTNLTQKPLYPLIGSKGKFDPIWNYYPDCLGASIGYGFLAFFVILIMYFMQRPRLQDDRDTVKGNAKWGDIKKMETILAEPFDEPGHTQYATNYIYSNKLDISYRSRDVTNVNTLVIGEPGTGKSRGYVKPNVLQMNSSYIITDPSGDLKEQVGEMLYRFGYNVRVFDINTKTHTSTYNPMKYCHTEANIKTLVNSFIKNTAKPGSENSSADPFWDAAMESYLCALIGLLVKYGDNPVIMDGKVYRKDFPNLCVIARMTNEPLDPKFNGDTSYVVQKPKTKTALGHIFNNLATHKEFWDETDTGEKVDPYCLRKWKDFETTPGKTADTILATTQVRLDPFNIDAIANMTSTDTIDLDSFGTMRDVLFVNIPVRDKTYNFLSSFMYTQLFDILYDRGEHKVNGTFTLQMPDGEFIKWYDQSWTKEKAEEDVKIVRDAHIEKVIVSEIAKGNAEDDFYFEIRDAKDRVITRRPTEELAKKYLEELKTITPEKNLMPSRDGSRENPTHVRFMLDEFANIGEIPEFCALLTTVRKYNISCDVIVQGVDQLKEMYKDTWGTIDTGCYITVFLGGKAKETVEFLSAKLGKTTTIVGNTSIDDKRFSHSNNLDAQELMTPDQIGRLSNKEELVLITGHNPIRDEKYNYPSHPNYKYTFDYSQDHHSQKCAFDYERYPIMKYIKQSYDVAPPSCTVKMYQYENGFDFDTFADLLACDKSEIGQAMSDNTATEDGDFDSNMFETGGFGDFDPTSFA